MAVSTYSWMSAPDISSDAAFRTWAQGIHDGFVECGWVQTADTGQVDLDAMTVPVANNTAAGFEMWRLDDALHATHPVFVKVEYGRGSTTTIPGTWWTVGKGSDGSGTITGTLLARTQATQTAGSSPELPSYMSGDGSSINIAMWSGLAFGEGSFFFALERSRSSAGAATGEAVAIVLGASSNQIVRVIGYNGTPGASQVADSIFLPVSFPRTINGKSASVASTLSKDGVVAPVLPIPLMAPGVTPWVSNTLVAVHPGDAGTTSVIQAATINGATRTYRAWTALNTASGTVVIGGVTKSDNLGNSAFWPAIAWDA